MYEIENVIVLYNSTLELFVALCFIVSKEEMEQRGFA